MIRTSILLQYIASNFVMIQQFTDNGQPGESRLIWKLQVRKMQIDSSRTIDWTLNNTPILQQSSMKYFLDRNLLFTGNKPRSEIRNLHWRNESSRSPMTRCNICFLCQIFLWRYNVKITIKCGMEETIKMKKIWRDWKT